MVKSTGAEYVILGHSERRQYYAESYEMLAEKVRLALANGLKVIFCIGEVKEEREAGKQNEVVKAQLEGSVFGLSAEEWKNITLAYEPVWAIGTGLTATPAQAEEIHAYIRSLVAEKYGKEAWSHRWRCPRSREILSYHRSSLTGLEPDQASHSDYGTY